MIILRNVHQTSIQNIEFILISNLECIFELYLGNNNIFIILNRISKKQHLATLIVALNRFSNLQSSYTKVINFERVLNNRVLITKSLRMHDTKACNT